MKKVFMVGLGFSILIPAFVSADFAKECRGVAVGVVSSMKAKDEVKGDDATQAALLAARRACAAVLEGFSDAELAEMSNEEKKEDKDAKNDSDKKISTWDLLTQDQEDKSGNKRLKRLRN